MLTLLAFVLPLFGEWAQSNLVEERPQQEKVRLANHVVLISIDGLRSDALLVLGVKGAPNLHRLLKGASTLNARTDPDYSTTLPNHAGMLTGRVTKGKKGHQWSKNSTPKEKEILACKGMFEIANQAKIHTALLATKKKFILFPNSWPGDIQEILIKEVPTEADVVPIQSEITAALVGILRSHKTSLTLAHYLGPDVAGHGHGWDLTTDSAYLKAVQVVDTEIGRLFDTLKEVEILGNSVAIILTTDHGGGVPFKNHHGIPNIPVNITIPFVVWMEKFSTKDLYQLNKKNRKDPSIFNPTAKAKVPPIRNSDAANLCLQLLQLPPVPGSAVNPRQELRVQ